MTQKIFVGNLPWTTTSDDLKLLFSPAGTIISAQVAVDKQTGRSSGYGFVEFETADEASRAITQWNGKDYNGRQLVVNEGKPEAGNPGNQ